jgi:glycosyltransferase involved in cell wall biosynthesis
VIEHGTHGLLAPEGDPVALAAALSRLATDHALAVRLGQAARQRVEQELRWSHIAARIEHAYCQAV